MRMGERIGVAWLQLSRDKLRLLVGVAGVAFAVILVFMQLGFRTAVYESATRYHRALDYDLMDTKLGAKTGTSTATTILGLVSTGDASAAAAARAGNITTIRHADYQFTSVLGIYQKFTTVVYGD